MNELICDDLFILDFTPVSVYCMRGIIFYNNELWD